MSATGSSTATRQQIEVSCTGFGASDLAMRAMNGHDELSRMFRLEVEVLHKEHDVDFNRFLGKSVTVTVPTKYAPGKTRAAIPVAKNRYFNGLVVRAEYGGSEGRRAAYRLTLAPRLWSLTLKSNCRIFQKKSVKDILKAILAEHGISGQDYDDSGLSGNYEKKEFLVQYRETDFNFVSRVMEQEGIYYFFKHRNGGHTMCVMDAKGAHKEVPGLEKIPFMQPSGAHVTDGDHIRRWNVTSQVHSHEYAHTDFDFKLPSYPLLTRKSGTGGDLKGEIFDYPGEYIYEDDGVREAAEGERYARIRLEELQSQVTVVQADASTISLYPGAVFQFETSSKVLRKDSGKKYLVCGASYSVSVQMHESGSGGGGDSWSTSLRVIESTVQYRPARITPKPIIAGPQTAVVVGKPGDEIYTDKYGRVKLKFHWDRESKSDDKSSCWVRVAQVWAGKTWGGMFLPRVGQEVIVEFLEGDPDQPIVTGRVYNGENMPPYELPAQATRSGIKSRSSKTGGVGDFNEFRFEDKKGAEEVYLHAQKNLTTIVEANDYRHVGNNQTIKIENNRTETLVKGNDKITIEKGKSETEAMQSILLKVGESSILIDNSGVTIKGMQIKIEGSAMIESKAPMNTLKGDATVTIKGGMVFIN